jgi:hypothetical protein
MKRTQSAGCTSRWVGTSGGLTAGPKGLDNNTTGWCTTEACAHVLLVDFIRVLNYMPAAVLQMGRK